MNLRCPLGRFFQLPQATTIEDYVYQADQDSFFAAVEFSSLSALNVNFTIRMQYRSPTPHTPHTPHLVTAHVHSMTLLLQVRHADPRAPRHSSTGH